MSETPRTRSPIVTFSVLCLAVVAAVVIYIVWSRTAEDTPAATLPAASPGWLADAQQHPTLLFRNSDLGPMHGRVALTRADGESRQVTPLKCDRVDFSGDTGVCLYADRGVTTTYRATTFDRAFVTHATLPLEGTPSRVRLSPDGSRAGITVFVAGDSYAVPGSFSTRTVILDTRSGETIGHLEEYAVVKDGAPFKEVDFNFWGVTFADSDRFYVTLGTGGRTYLLEAHATMRTARVIGTDVECPSLSPDGTRVAFKQRETVEGRLIYRVTVLELSSGRRTSLSERRSVDDQVEWLDTMRVIYGLPSEESAGRTDIWSVSADGQGKPALLVANAWSPSAIIPTVAR